MWRGTHEKYFLLITACPCMEGIPADRFLWPKHWIATLRKCIAEGMAVLMSKLLSVLQGCT